MRFWSKLLVPVLAALLLVSSPALSQSLETGIGAPLNPEVSGDVELWHFWGSPTRRNAIRRVVAICEQKLPNIKVDEVFKPWGDIWTANIAAVAAGSGMPDVIVADRLKLPRDAAEGIYQSLQPLGGDNINPDAFWDFAWEQTLYQGESYGIPFETDVRVLFYNQSLLEQAGVAPPETWEDVWAAADQLDIIGEDGSIERMTFFPLEGNAGVDFWVYTTGYRFVQDGHPVVNDPQVVRTLEWILTWIDRYGGWDNVQRHLQSFGAAPNDSFMSSGVLMKVDVAGYNSILGFYRPRVELENGETPRMEWGASLPPYAEEPSSWSGGFALSIPTGAEDPEAAWEFMKCAGSVDGQTSWARDTYAIPTVQAAATAPELMADPLWQFFVEAMEVSVSTPYVPAYPNWISELNNRYELVWTGEMTPEEMLDEAQAAIDAVIEQNQQ